MSPTDELPKPPAALLDQIRLGNIPLRPSFTEAEDATAVSRPAAVSETMLRGGLLHEIATGKKLRHVADRVSGNKDAAPSATISRGGFLHELRMRTPLAASTSSASVVSAARSSGASQRVSSAPSSGGSTASGQAPLVFGTAVIKAGWLHKRAQNGIWQRRFFVLTTDTVFYASQEPKKGKTIEELLNGTRDLTRMPLTEVHDVHPMGHGSEFCMLHQERRLRLRASCIAEASLWCSSLIGAALEAGRGKLPASPSAGTVVRGLVAPSLQLSAVDRISGERLRIDYLPDALSEAASQLGEAVHVREAVWAGAASVLESGGEIDQVLPALLAEWLAEGRSVDTAAATVDTSDLIGTTATSTAAGGSAGSTSAGPLSELLRWAHPRLLQPALGALKLHLDGGKLSGLHEVDRQSWATAIDFDATEPPYVITMRHALWHTCNLTSAGAGAGGAGSTADERPDVTSPKLRFQTELSLVFAPGSVSEVTHSDMKVVDFEFEGNFDRGVKDDLKGALKPLCLPHLDYALIWRRPLHRLPVHKDVPRLLRGLLVVGPDGKDLYHDDGSVRPAEPATVIAAVRKLMLVLARALDGPSTVQVIEEQLSNYLPPDTGDVAGGLRHFLLESGVPESSLFIQCMKAIHQEIIFPAVMNLRTSIYNMLPYKDMKGEWRVRIDVRASDIRVSHLKWEQTQEWDATDFFKFRWALTLTFDRRMLALQAATLNILDYAFGSVTTSERQHKVERTLRPWLAPGTLYKRVWLSLGEPE